MSHCDTRGVRLIISIVVGIAMIMVPAHTVAQVTQDWTIRVSARDGLPAHVIFVPSQFRAAWEPGHMGGGAPILVALHGLGDRGESFAARLLPWAEADGVVVIAPTFVYGDWKSLQVAHEDLHFSEQVLALVDSLTERTGGVPMSNDRVSLLGFSRGAQLAHRFALAHPERTRLVLAFSAGTYTLPARSAREKLPFGTADLETYIGYPLDLDALKEVEFLVGVGLLDTNPNNLPRAWDEYQGSTRVDRATAFVESLRSVGILAELHVFPGVGHEFASAMVADGLAFLDAENAIAATQRPAD
jgi:pimeloyl-ACP methyl ester carboxylesterase